MTCHDPSEATRIRELIENWTRAVSSGDRKAILAHHAPDLLMFLPDRCDGTSPGPLDLRLTVGLRKIDSEWTIMHEHHSVPTTEERFCRPTQQDLSERGSAS